MTARLSALAVEHWRDIDGYAVGHGLGDLRDMPLDRFSNYLWWFFTRNQDEKGVNSLRTKLWRPVKPTDEIDKRSPWHPSNEMDALQSIKSQLGG